MLSHFFAPCASRLRNFTVRLALLGLAPLGFAQEEVPPRVPEHDLERLEALLQDLRSLGPSIWEAKLARVERRIADHRARAAQLRAQIEELTAELARTEARAGAAEGELAELRALAQHVHPGELPAVSVRAKAAPASEATIQVARADAPASGAPSAEGAPPATPPMPAPTPMPAPQPVPNFAEHVLPIFEAACTVCHDDADAKGGQDLSTYEATLRGGSSGATVVAGNADGSRLYRLSAHLEEPFMPKGRSQLGARELETLKRWIDGGAPRDAAAAAAAQKAAEEAAASEGKRKEESPAEAASAASGAATPLALDLPFHALRFAELPAPLAALAHAPTAPLLAAAGVEQVLLVDARTREILGALPFPGRVTRLQFSRDGARLLAAGGDANSGGRAVLFDVQSGAVVTTAKQGRDQLFAAALSPGQSLLALGGPTRRVQALRTADGEALYEIRAHGDWVLGCAFSADGNYLATGDRGGAAFVWQADTGRDVSSLRGHEGALAGLAFCGEANVLVSLGEDGFACGWDVERGTRTWRTRVGDPPGTALASLEDGSVLASAGKGALVRLAAKDGKPQGQPLPELGTWIASLAVSTDGRSAYAGTATGELVIVDLAERKVLTRASLVPLGNAPTGDAPKG
ncbi:MAG: PQQ-binding-like beta-propeller repeat protein [Planctomycetes bacterium]|nr:PQQ-binding-like beta-propeller repeat protein [Planctomycetota bacterium]